jgi:hypothetical protein
MRPCLSSLLVLLLACTPQVSANISNSEQPPPVQVEAEPQASPTSGALDVVAALDASEALLVGLDQFLTGPERPYVNYEAMDSWLDEEGLRSLYWYVKQMSRTGLVLDGMSNIFGVPVFVSGPHTSELDYHASEFGHYNPEFVARLGQAARALGQDSARVARTREAFDRRLRRQAITYLMTYAAVHHDPAWFARITGEYAAQIERGDVDFAFYEEISPMAEAMDDRGFSWYETDTAAYFWMRRELDGTAAAWRDAISALLSAYGVSVEDPPGLPKSARR